MKNNPRDTPKALETLIATYDASLEGLPRPSADSNDTVAVTTTVLTEDSKEQDGEIPLLQPSSGRYGVVDGELPTGDSAEDEAADEMRFMSTSHATEVFRVSSFMFCLVFVRLNWQKGRGVGGGWGGWEGDYRIDVQVSCHTCYQR